jgi:hypothetical protein
LSVQAEAAVFDATRRRRIDLLIRWTDDNDNPHCFVLEAKFQAPINSPALEAYAAFARQSAGAPERAYLFFVVPKQRPVNLGQGHWRQIIWFSLLRRWERRLTAHAIDEDFLLLRSALRQCA